MSTKDMYEKDYYKVLGVSKDATPAEVKKSFRKLAKSHHPDSNDNDAKATAKYKEITEAYDVLSDADKRKAYDEARSTFAQFGGFRGGQSGGGRPGATTFDLSDLLGRMNQGGSGGLGDVLGNIFNRGSGTSQRRPRRGADIESTVSLSFDQALTGVTLPLRLASEGPCATCAGTGARAGTTPRVCPRCEGAGQIMVNAGGFAMPEPCPDCRGRGLLVDDPCPVCHGSGRAMSARTVQARIPAGVREGQRIRLRRKGAPGEAGGDPGDLIIAVSVTPHAVFGRDGDSVTVTVPITIDEAALGAQVSVPAPDGSTVKLRVPAGTANGRTVRARGRGVRRKDGTNGDLLVTWDVVVPDSLSVDQAAALEAFRTASAGVDPRADLMARAAGG